MSINDDSWVDVAGYGGVYQVNTQGQLRSWYGKKGILRAAPTLIRGMDKGGYRKARLYASDGSYRDIAIHRLVLMTFRPQPDQDELLVMHKNDIPDDNRLENLEWGTWGDNNRDREAKGRGAQPKGVRHNMRVLGVADVQRIRELYRDGAHTYKSLGQQFGMDPTQIMNIVLGRHWKDAGGPIAGKDYSPPSRQGRCNDYPARE